MPTVLSFSAPPINAQNEDAFYVQPHRDDESVILCALADGQGGRPGGQEAAKLACAVVIDKALGYSVRQLRRQKTWSKILGAADEALRKTDDAGFTTLIGLCVTGRSVCGASSGDSAAVILNGHARRYVLTQNQKKNPPVGSGQAHFVSFKQPLARRWRVLLMSDGLWKYAGWERVNSILAGQSGDEMVEAFKTAARTGTGGFRDDVTFIAIQSDT